MNDPKIVSKNYLKAMARIMKQMRELTPAAELIGVANGHGKAVASIKDAMLDVRVS